MYINLKKERTKTNRVGVATTDLKTDCCAICVICSLWEKIMVNLDSLNSFDIKVKLCQHTSFKLM